MTAEPEQDRELPCSTCGQPMDTPGCCKTSSGGRTHTVGGPHEAATRGWNRLPVEPLAASSGRGVASHVEPGREGIDTQPETLAEMQARYLAVRKHTLSTDGMEHDKAIVAQAEYVLGEAAELFVAVKRQEVNTFTPGQTAWHTRHEIADVVLATVSLANLLGVSVEDCIREKTEADRGRG